MELVWWLYTFSTKCGKVWGKDVEEHGKTVGDLRKKDEKTLYVDNAPHTCSRKTGELSTQRNPKLLESRRE